MGDHVPPVVWDVQCPGPLGHPVLRKPYTIGYNRPDISAPRRRRPRIGTTAAGRIDRRVSISVRASVFSSRLPFHAGTVCRSSVNRVAQ